MSEEYLTSASPGLVLQQARESLGWTQREVGDELHLPVGTIDALERGDKTRLPDYVFTRGYIRSYAKLLELDADGLVAALAEDYGQSVADEHVPGPDTTQTIARPVTWQELLGRPVVWLSVLGILVVLVATLWLLLSSGSSGDEEPAAAAVSGRAQTAPVPGSAEDNLQDTVADPATQVAQQTLPAAAAEVEEAVIEDAMVETYGEEPQPASETAQQETAAAASVRRLTPDGDDRLTLAFSEDCWVEIKDLAGNGLFSNLGQAGQSLEFAGAGPFRVLLGYAPGAQLRFNGEAVALNPHTRNNVASLVIGQ